MYVACAKAEFAKKGKSKADIKIKEMLKIIILFNNSLNFLKT